MSRTIAKSLLTTTAVIEGGTAIVFMSVPSLGVRLLLGTSLDAPAGLVVGRVLGAALFALGAACWLARDDADGRAGRGLVVAMLTYNVAVIALLGHARFGLGVSGVGFLPAAALHSALAVWCFACLRTERGSRTRIP